MSSKVIWYIHPYAGGPNVGRYDRPYYLCKSWNDLDIKSVIITANNHHLLDQKNSAGGKLNRGVFYEFLSTPKYKDNGFLRLFNMAWFSISLLWSSRRLKLTYGKPDLVIYSSPHPYGAVSAKLISWIYKAKSVFEVRDLWPLSLVELAGVSTKHPLVYLTSFLEKFSYRNFDFTVSLLPCTLKYMRSRGLLEDKWRYIPNGVSIEEKNSENILLYENYSCLQLARDWRSKGYFVVVYPGALGKPNNIGSLVEALRLVKNERVRVVIVGRGELEDELRRKIAKYDLSDRMSIFAQVPKPVIQRLLTIVDAGYISLQPQPIFRFGISPNKLYDYMQASLPVLFAVRSGNNPVLDADCGLTADPEDIRDIAKKMDLLSLMPREDLKLMGANGFEKVRFEYNYKCLANRYLELLN